MMVKTNSCLDDYKRLCFVDAPSYSEHARLMAYVKTLPPADGGFSVQQIILLDLNTRTERIITAAGSRENSPTLSDDGSKLLFVSNAEHGEQVWLADLATGETRRLTHMQNGVKNPVCSPDTKYVAFISDETQAEADKQPVYIKDFGYKDDARMGFSQKAFSHIWIVKTDGSTPRCITDGAFNHVMPVFSPDSQTLIFTSNRERPANEYIGMDLYAVPVDGGDIRRLTKDIWVAYYPKSIPPIFTPDGKYIVCGGLAPSLEAGIPPVHLFRVDVNTGELHDLFPNDSEVDASCFLYNGEGGGGNAPSPMQISADGNNAFFIAGKNGAAHVYEAKIFGNPSIRQVTFGDCCYRYLSKPTGSIMPAIRTDFTHTQEIFMLDTNNGESVQITNTNPWLDSVALTAPQEIWFNTLDGNGRVQGWAFAPQNAKEGEKYPTILYIHGGPSPFYGYAMTYEHHCICGAGFGLILCNPRGSSGYTLAHGKTTLAFDGSAYTDFLQFVMVCAEQCTWLDETRIGVTGGSYGGYMTNWLIGHTKIFKAAVTQRSISNAMLSYANSDMAGSSKAFKNFTDFQMQKIEESPVAYAQDIDIPLLILHSQNDCRTPVEHAHQLFVAVKDTHPDLPVRLVVFPNSNHSMLMGAGTPGVGTMKMRLRHYKEMLDWFTKYL